MLRTLRAGHRMLLRASAEDELLQSMCRVLVDEGGYRIVWIGYAEDDAAKTIRPMAHAGAEAEFFRSAHFSWDAARREWLDDKQKGYELFAFTSELVRKTAGVDVKI